MKTILIVQARMGSSRLPGKVMKPLIKKEPLISILLKRLKRVKNIDELIVSTSNKKKDNDLANFLKIKKVRFYRGSEIDTLSRFYHTAREAKAKIIVRITADCPLSDPTVIDKFIDTFKKEYPDYLANTLNIGNKIEKYWQAYPDGFDIEIFTFDLLKKIFQNKNPKFRKEGAVVSYFIKNHNNFRNKLKILNMKLPYFINNNIKLSVDSSKDFNLIKKIFNHFSPDLNFGISEVMDYLGMKKETKKINSSRKLWEKANKFILGGNMLLSKNPDMFLPDNWPTYFSKSKGYNIWDLDGKKYSDMSLMGVGTNILGYNNPSVDNAVKNVVKKGNLTSLNCPEEVELAERLISIHPWAEKVKFARTGGEANTIAIRLARSVTSRHNVAFCGYHGWHDWYLSSNLNNNKNLDNHLIPGLNPLGVNRNLKKTSFPFEYNNISMFKKIISKHNIGVVKMEVCRSTKPNLKFLKEIRNITKKKGIVLIFDECTSGFRENLGGLHQKINVIPDMAILGKALGNGYAITAVLGKKDIMNKAKDSFISSTFWTERIGPTAALKTIEIMEKTKSWKTITKLGISLTKIWEKLSKRHKLDIKVMGLPSLAKFYINSDDFLKYKTFIAERMLQKRFLASSAVYMSTSHDNNILKKYEECLDEIFYQISKCENGSLNIDYILKSKVVKIPFGRIN